MSTPNEKIRRLMSMESLDATPVEPVAPVSAVSETADAIETGETEAALDGLVSVVGNLETIRNKISGSLPEGGLGAREAAGYIHATKEALAPVGLDGTTVMLSQECFNNDSIRLRATELSMESIGKTIGKVADRAWQVFVRLYKRIVEAIRRRISGSVDLTENLSELISQVKAIKRPQVTCEVKGKTGLLVNSFGKVMLDDASSLCSSTGYFLHIANYTSNYIDFLKTGNHISSWSDRVKDRPTKLGPVNSTFFTSEPGEYYPRDIALVISDSHPQDVGVKVGSVYSLLTKIDTTFRPKLVELSKAELLNLTISENDNSVPAEALVFPREAISYLNGMLNVVSEVMVAVITLAKQVASADKTE